jgi:zinc protease
MHDSRYTIQDTGYKIVKRSFLYLASCILHLVSIFLLFTDAYALDVDRTVLGNGLTLMIVERHNLPVVKVAVSFDAGSLRETADKAGLASLTASLLTEGTEKRTASEINEAVEFVGASLDASGGDDYITVNLSVLKKDLDLGFDLLSDVILNPSFPEGELSKKRERIKGSLKAQEEDPDFVASREFKKTVFGNHAYGRLIQGSTETLDKIKRDDVVNFHVAYYVSNNAIMSVVGDITPEEVKGLIEKYFAKWHPSPIPLPQGEGARGRVTPVFSGQKTITIDKDLTQANIILGHIGISRGNPDYYAVSVMNYMLGGGGFSSRLVQNIREDRGLAYDIHSFFAADKYGGSFQVGLQTKNESANTAIEEVLREIIKIRDVPVSDNELADAKSFLIGSFPMKMETSSRIAGFLIAVEYYGLGMDYIDKYPVYINSITKEDVLRVAKKYLDPENFALIVVADQKKAGLKKEFK